MCTFRQTLSLTNGLEFPLGFDNENNFRKADLLNLNHLLVSGGSGFGKTVFLDTMILSLAAHNGPEKLKFAFCDTKGSEFTQYSDMDHLLLPVATSLREISFTIGMVLSYGQDRLKEFSENKVKNISAFNDSAWENYKEELPHIVFFIDDLSTITNQPTQTRGASAYVLEKIENILSIGRAAGIHLVSVTQNPSQKKMRALSSLFFSKMVFCSPAPADIRLLTGQKAQGPGPIPGEALFCNGANLQILRTLLPTQSDYCLAEGEATLIDRVAEIAISLGHISETVLQDVIGLGPARSGAILSQLEDMGLIASADDSGSRETLISPEQWASAIAQIEDG